MGDAKLNVRPPSPLELGSNKIEQWKLFKRRWQNYALLSELSSKSREFQVALLENCMSDDALRIYEGFTFTTADDVRTTA